MSQSSSLRAEIFREVFDESSAASEEEVKDYALKIGINPLNEPHLLNIARDGLMQALPEGWSPCYDNETKAFYYYNAESKETRWDHPLDDVYRNIVKQIRSGSISSFVSGEEDSKTSLREDLKSFEEATIPSEMLPKPIESLRPLGLEGSGAIKKSSILAPLRGRGASPARQLSSPDLKEAPRPDARKLSLPVKRGLIDLSMKRSTSNAELGTRSSSGAVAALEFGSAESLPARSPARIDVAVLGEAALRQRSLSPLQEKHPRGFTHATELTLKGGGSMFLKSKKRESPDSVSAERSLLAALEPSSGSAAQAALGAGQPHKSESTGSPDNHNARRPPSGTSDSSRIAPKGASSERSDSLGIPLKSFPGKISNSSGIPLKSGPSGLSNSPGMPLKKVPNEVGDTSGIVTRSIPSEASDFFGVKLKSIASDASFHQKSVVSDSSFQLKGIASDSSSQLKSFTSDSSFLMQTAASDSSFQLKETESEEGSQLKESAEADAAPKGILRDVPWDTDVSAMTGAQTQQWRRQQMEDEPKSVRFNLDKDIGTIRFDASESEDTEDCTGDESDAATAAGAAARALSFTSASDRDDVDAMSDGDGIVDSETSVRFGLKRTEHDISQKLKNLYLPREHGDDSMPAEMFGGFVSRPPPDKPAPFGKVGRAKAALDGKGSINGQDVRKEHEIKDTAAAKISEKRQLGSSLFRSEVLSKSVESIVLNGDLDKSLDMGNTDDKPQRQYDGESQERERLKKELEEEERKEREKLRKLLEEEQHQTRDRFKKEIEEEENRQRQRLRRELEEEENRQRERLRKELEEEENRQRERLRKELEEEENRERQRLKKELEEAEKQERERLQTELEAKKSEEQEKLRKELTEEGNREREEMKKLVQEEGSRDQDRLRKEQETGNGDRELKELEDERVEQERLKNEQDLRMATYVAELLSEQIAALKVAREEHKAAMDQARRVLESEREAELAALRERLDSERRDCVAALTADGERQLQALTAQLQAELADKQAALGDKHTQDMDALGSGTPAQAEAAHRDALARVAAEHKEELERLRLENSVATAAARVEHTARLEAIRAECVREEARVVELKSRLKPADHDSSASGPVFEKLRCEKRLLEDKYRTLKDKYVRLKGDVKLSLDRRRKRDSAANTTGSETERSTSHRAQDSRSAASDSFPAPLAPAPVRNDNETAPRARRAADNNNLPQTPQTPQRSILSDDTTTPGVDSDNVSSCGSRRAVRACEPRRRRQAAGRARAPRFPTAPAPATDGSPVDALRRQLQKLDDLDEKFPAATHTDTYLRYPFSDTGGQMGSAELEFFRHRIHLERDSVRRAKDMLVAQRGNFRVRQREVQRQSATPLADEERDLSDMEVSLHRTRGLLGEKIIRLRHLEAALHRAATPRGVGGDTEPATLSDVSSHSGGSSGISSFELPHDAGTGQDALGVVSLGGRYNESTEIMRSLENLNTEIRDIWDVLHKSRPSAGPPPALLFPDWLRGFRPAAGADPSLAERTKSLRDWLRHARHDTPDTPNGDHAHC